MAQRFTTRNKNGIGLALLLCASSLLAQTPGELRATRAFDAAKKLGPPELYAFLQPMPKGADLHMHLSGAVYAESFIAEAIEQNLCVDPVKLALAKNIGLTKSLPPQPVCAEGNVPAATALKDQHLYDALVDSFSMRSFVPTSGRSGHDQFFDTFERFGAVKDPGAWLDEVATRAAKQNEQYLEIMQTPPFGNAAGLGYKLGWPEGAEKNISPDQLAKLREALLAGGLRDEVAVDEKAFADAKTEQRKIENCAIYEKYTKPGPEDHPSHGEIMEMEESGVSNGCSIKIHWLYQVLRAFPPQQVFAQTLLGFEVASADPDVVGINFVQPEDARLAMGDYHLQMQMLDYLHTVYPKVHITLHAGELAPGLVPPEGLSFHIREAIELGHAERIGHGVDVLYEDNVSNNGLIRENLIPLLKEMAARHIMVEINLTSNEGILGIKDKQHPLHAYMAAHVPVALSTDDEGVSRIDLTHEYVKGAEDQDLTYLDLKRMARTSLEHAFLHGESLWLQPDDFAHRKSVCVAPITPTSNPTDACKTFLTNNEKAAAEYELESRFLLFEAAQR
jgi:adenosine deaminase